MKKILIVSHAMEIGGAERALIGLLEAIDLREYAVDLLMIAKYFERIGDHAANIAEWVEFSITGVHEKLRPEGFQRTEEQREEK